VPIDGNGILICRNLWYTFVIFVNCNSVPSKSFDFGASQTPIKTNAPLISHVDQINLDFKEKEVEKYAKEHKLGYVNLRNFPINPDALVLVSKDDAVEGRFVPIHAAGKELRFAAVDPTNAKLKEIAASYTAKGFVVQLYLISEESLSFVLRLYDKQAEKVGVKVLELNEDALESYDKEIAKMSALVEHFQSMSDVDILNAILLGSVKTHASDIHFQPEKGRVLLRYRIDGVLHQIFILPPDIYENILTNLKFSASMKLNVGYKPQDGKLNFQVTGRQIDIRMSTLPTEFGEAVVMRLLDSKKSIATFDSLGLVGRNRAVLEAALQKSEGMLLVTGPTGSGKTTTLYTVLHMLNTPDVKIITLEDPIEYHLENISQSQIRETEGYTFALGLRAILRQDPNIIMVGEIRDQETADIAVQSALTGHVMLSTVHTNSAVETIPRLLNMGVKRYLVGPALNTIVAQRLVRKACTACRKEVPLTGKIAAEMTAAMTEAKKAQPELEIPSVNHIYEAVGCPACGNTGYAGQVALFEILNVTKAFEELILAEATPREMIAQAQKDGMVTLYQDGLLKVLAGLTTIAEVMSVTSA